MTHRLAKSRVAIRLARLRDLKIVLIFINELENSDFDIGTFKRIYAANISDPAIIYALAWYNKIPIGFISCHIQNLLHHNCKVAEIQEMFVIKEHRNKGVGVLLLEFLKLKLNRKKIGQLEVVSNRKRRRTHQFYLSQNFKWTSKKFVIKFR